MENVKCKIGERGLVSGERGMGNRERSDLGGEIWTGYGGRLIYLKGYRDGSDEERVQLLKFAIETLCHF